MTSAVLIQRLADSPLTYCILTHMTLTKICTKLIVKALGKNKILCRINYSQEETQHEKSSGANVIHTFLQPCVLLTSKEPVCPRVELILKIIIILLIIFLGFIKSKPC